MSGEDHSTADGGGEGLSFDAIADDDLPEWATDEASLEGERADGAAETTDSGAVDAGDGTENGAAAVNFANVQTGASESVAVDERGGKRMTAPSVDSADAVAFEGAEGRTDTGGTSIQPDLDDVDPGEFLDGDDEGFPRPGAGAGGGTTVGARSATASGATTGAGTGPADDGTVRGTRQSGGTTPSSGGSGARRSRPSGGDRLGGRDSVLPADPALAFGLGMGVMLVVAASYLFLMSLWGWLAAAVVVIGAAAILVGAASALDLFEPYR